MGPGPSQASEQQAVTFSSSFSRSQFFYLSSDGVIIWPRIETYSPCFLPYLQNRGEESVGLENQAGDQRLMDPRVTVPLDSCQPAADLVWEGKQRVV